MRLIHLCNDYPWTKGAYHLFEKSFPNQNLYVTVKAPSNPPLRHISYIHELIEIPATGNYIQELNEIFNKGDLIVLHGLSLDGAILVENVGQYEKFLWLAMGADIYQNPYIYPNEIYGEKTAKVKKYTEGKNVLIKKLKSFYLKFRYNKSSNYHDELRYISKVAKKINFFASFQNEQFELLKRTGKLNPDASFLHFSFYPLESIINYDQITNGNGSDILLGNSASYTNNHFEIIDILAQFKIGSKKVYCPLSYGNRKYASAVIKYGRMKLKENFVALTEFLPMDAYNHILNSCGIVIINTYRGQAAGNILAALYHGSKLYLSEKNLIYHYLKRIGANVYSIEKELNKENPLVLKTITDDEVVSSRKVLEGQISEAILINELKSGISGYIKKLYLNS